MMTTERRHGRTTGNDRTYRSWAGIIQRCTNPNDKRWHDYGGRGIAVCERWREFLNFLADMGERPEGKSIDRINNNLGYSPENCRWATPLEQQNNMSTNVIVTHDGKTKTVREWADLLKIEKQTLYFRLRRGWTVERALGTPLRWSRS